MTEHTAFPEFEDRKSVEPDIINDGSNDSIGPHRIREHYESIKPVLEALGSIEYTATDGEEGRFAGVGVYDRAGWYITEPRDGDEYPLKRQCIDLARDTGYITENTDRAVYALTSYKREGSVHKYTPVRFDDGEADYPGSIDTATPPASEIRGLSIWGDVDLADALKDDRRELSQDTREIIEDALEAYCDWIADVFFDGNRDAVFALDSVGGAYILGPPAVLTPIIEHVIQSDPVFDDTEEDIERVVEHVLDRSNELLKGIEEDVNAAVSGAADVIQPDWVNNVNRQYKAPLSLHTDYQGVVTPLNTESVSYEFTHIDEVDESLIDRTVQWAEDLTSDRHKELVDAFIDAIWDGIDGGESWCGTVTNWLEAEKNRVEETQRAQDKRNECSGDRSGSSDSTLTASLQHVYDALDRIDVADVVRWYACDGWDTGVDSDSKTEFNPSWRMSSSGSSCFVNHDHNVFGDPGDGGGGGAVKAMALADGIITDASDDLAGEDWWDAVDALRNEGYDVPVWVPEDGSVTSDGEEYECTPVWGVEKAAVALDVVEEASEMWRDDAQTAVNPEVWNETLAELDNRGWEHGREYEAVSSDENAGADLYLDVLEQYADDDWDPFEDGEKCLLAALQAKEDGAVPADVDPPSLAVNTLIRYAFGYSPESDFIDDANREFARELFDDLTPRSAREEFGIAGGDGDE